MGMAILLILGGCGNTAGTTGAASSDAALKSLEVSAGTLTPAFAAGTTEYAVSVANSVTSLTVTGAANHDAATLNPANGTLAKELSVGSGNVFEIAVTAEDGTATRTYKVTVTREPAAPPQQSSDATLKSLEVSAGTLTPAFAAGTTEYAVSVANSVASLTVTGAASHDAATLSPVSGTLAKDLSVGSGNVFEIAVTAEDGTATKTYKVTVTREPAAQQQYTIVFDSQGGTEVAAITRDAGSSVAAPTAPTRTGFTFHGWFDAATGGTLYVWPHTLNADVTMYARWQDTTQPSGQQRTITFDSRGGQVVVAITADEGTAVPEPADPLWTDHSFEGWFSSAEDGEEYTWPHTLTANVIMYAHWQDNNPPEERHTITFDSRGGQAVVAITADEGTAVPEPADPLWTDHSFEGWFSSAEGGEEYTWPHILAADVIMYARWQADPKAPASPVIAGIAGGNKTLTVSWIEVSGATGYEMYHNTAATAPAANAAPSKTVSGGGTLSAVIDKLADGTSYYVWVRALNATGASPWSGPLNGGTQRNGKAITAFKIGTSEGVINESAKTIAITIPYGAASFTAEITVSPGAAASVKAVENSAGVAVYTVRAENGETEDYTVTIIRQGADAITLGFADAGEGIVDPEPITLSKSGPVKSLILISAPGYKNHNWMADGKPAGSGDLITLNAADYLPGKHFLSVEVYKNDILYSKELAFTVTE
jgi:uncharacterized repeat protein (TIGR02543 family)